MRKRQTTSKQKPPIMTVDLEHITPVVFKSTFFLYERGILESAKRFLELGVRIGRETGLIPYHSDNTKKIKEIILRSPCKITREELHHKLDTVGRIVREIYGLPQAVLHIGEKLF